MSDSKKGSQSNNTKLNILNKATALNPNAAEFVPSSLRSSSSLYGSASKTAEATARFGPSGNSGKAVLDRSESSISYASDEEAHQFWHQQLPEDITPDFKDMSEDDSQGLRALSLASLFLHETNEVSRFPDSTGSAFELTEQHKLLHHLNGSSFAKKMRYAISSYGDDPTSASFLNLPSKPWDKQMVNADQLLGNGIELHPYHGSMGHGFMSNVVGKHSTLDETDMNPLKFLASQFPGFAAESLAEVYVANGCDLNLTTEMLTQLELQVDGGFNQNVSSKALSVPNLNAMDFPTLTVADDQNGPPKYPRDDVQQRANPYQSSEKENFLLPKSRASYTSRGVTDFASAVRKLASQDSGMWKSERSSSTDSSVGSSRSSNVLATSYGSGHGQGVYSDRLQSRGTVRATPSWVETGEAVASMYTELREEARDHARLRNAYLEQARQAYLVGNKVLAKELSAKGQMHNMHMKAAHGRAQESIYRQRNPVGQDMHGNGRGNERMIDLHGLHVSEAIHVLKHELNALRSTARLAEQRLQVYILVGTGHHTKGSRTPARLPIAVQRYLLEEEDLDYSEPQPGLLRVVIY